jgi:hypothetical protein
MRLPPNKRDSLGEHTTFRSGPNLLKPFALFTIAWGLAGLGAVIGSILGNAAGKAGLFVGAVIGGVVGVGAAVAAASKVGWLPFDDRAGALFGGVVGFAVAVPIAVTSLHTPVTPVLICGLAGVGVLMGVGVARGWRGRS